MRIIYPVLGLLLCWHVSCGQFQPAWDWARAIAQVEESAAPVRISADPFGNVFVMGQSKPNAVPSLIPDSGAFLARYDRTGQLTWAKKIDGSPRTLCTSPLGDIYIAGTKRTGGAASTNNSAFIMKFDAGGNLAWEKNYIGWSSCIFAMTVSAAGNIYVTGVAPPGFQMDSWIKMSRNSFFVARINAAGNALWLKGNEILPDTNTSKYIEGGNFITVDANEKLYIEYTSVSCPNWSCDSHFMLKLDMNGNYYFHKFYEDYRGICHGLLVEPDGDMIMAHNAGVWTSGGSVMLHRYDSTMSIKRWSLQIGGWQCQRLLMDAGPVSDRAGFVYVGGAVGEQCWWGSRDSVSFGPKTIVTDSVGDVVVAKIDKLTGMYADAFHVPGRLFDGVSSLATDKLGNCYVAGYFNRYYGKDASHQNDTLCFGADCITGGANDLQIFLARLQLSDQDYNDAVSLRELQMPNIRIAPNPSAGIFALKGVHEGWSVYDLNGKLLSSGTGDEIDLSEHVEAIYVLRLKTSTGIFYEKIVKRDAAR